MTQWDDEPGPRPPLSGGRSGPAPGTIEWSDGTWEAGSLPTPPPDAQLTSIRPAPTSSSSTRSIHRGRGRATGRGWLVVAALIVALALISAGYLVGQAQRGEAELGSGSSTTRPTASAPSTGEEPVVAVAAALGPAVVQVRTSDGLGSGIIYDADGLIVTNAHVVGSATTVGVALSTGTQLTGQVLGADAAQDIAVIRVDPGANHLVAAQLATEPPRVGSVTVAIGSPFGLSGTVTSGVVSAVDRPVGQQAVTTKLIQTDAPINPGNSGGALADIHGQVIGVNAGIVSRSGDNNGIGFAIPIATAMAAATRITQGG